MARRHSPTLIDAARLKIHDEDSNGHLGAGSFGSVFRGSLDGSAVAVKQMNHGSREERVQFEREIRRYIYVSSPHIVQFYGLSHRPGFPEGWLFVQELMEGGSIFDALRKLKHETAARQDAANRDGRPLPPHRCFLRNRDLVRLALQISWGIRYLHGDSLTHGDIKPQNILLSEPLTGVAPDGTGYFPDRVRAKLTDFGLSRSYNEAVQTVAQGRLDDVYGPVGTFAYLAPEAIPGFRGLENARAADIYSLGVLFYEMASCKRPWEGRSIHQIRDAVTLHAERPTWGGDEIAPPEFKDLIARCWAQNPSDRPSAQEVADALEHMLAELPKDRMEETDIGASANGSSSPAHGHIQHRSPLDTANTDDTTEDARKRISQLGISSIDLTEPHASIDSVDFERKYPSPVPLSEVLLPRVDDTDASVAEELECPQVSFTLFDSNKVSGDPDPSSSASGPGVSPIEGVTPHHANTEPLPPPSVMSGAQTDGGNARRVPSEPSRQTQDFPSIVTAFESEDRVTENRAAAADQASHDSQNDVLAPQHISQAIGSPLLDGHETVALQSDIQASQTPLLDEVTLQDIDPETQFIQEDLAVLESTRFFERLPVRDPNPPTSRFSTERL